MVMQIKLLVVVNLLIPIMIFLGLVLEVTIRIPISWETNNETLDPLNQVRIMNLSGTASISLICTIFSIFSLFSRLPFQQFKCGNIPLHYYLGSSKNNIITYQRLSFYWLKRPF